MTSPPAYADPNNNTVKKLTKAVTLDGVLDHLEALQEIADENGDRAPAAPATRRRSTTSSSSSRPPATTPTVQEFEFDYFEENSELIRVSPNPRTFVDGTDFLRNTFDSGIPEGTATGTLVPVGIVVIAARCRPTATPAAARPPTSPGFPAAPSRSMQRGTCGFAVKALNAQAAGAAGVVIMNEGQPGRTGLINMIGDATGPDDPGGLHDLRGRREPRRHARARRSR